MSISHERLHAFLDRYRQVREPPRAASDTQVDPAAIAALVDRLRPLLADARRQGQMANIWAVAGLGRKEVQTASVLAWLLDPTAGHGAGDAYGQALWRFVRQAECEGDDQLDFDLVGLRGAFTEVCFLGDRADRIDLVLEADDALVFIEVKIDAGQQADQLGRYARKAERVSALRRKSNWAVLYLSELDDALPPRCRRISWSDVAGVIRDTAATLEPGFFQTAAIQFANHVSRLH
jgi:hypothetical protein